MKRAWLIVLLIILWILPVKSQGNSTWYAWAYAEATDTLLLFNQEGDLLEIDAPTAPEIEPAAAKFFAISRDGADMAVVSYALDGRPLVIFYDLNSGAQNAWLGKPEESYLPNLDGSLSIPSVTFSQDGSLFALGLSDFETWRVVIFLTETGQAAVEINQDYEYVQPIMEAAGSFVIPVVRLFDEQGVHVQLVSSTIEGMAEYPAFLWKWDGNVVESPYTEAFMDIFPLTNEIVYPMLDDETPAPDPIGPRAAFNAIDMSSSDFIMTLDEDLLITRTRWAEGTQAVLYETQDPETFETIWNVVPADAPDEAAELLSQYIDVRGTPDGFLSIEGDTGIISFHSVDDPYDPQPITTVITGDGLAEILWVSPEGYPYNGPG